MMHCDQEAVAMPLCSAALSHTWHRGWLERGVPTDISAALLSCPVTARNVWGMEAVGCRDQGCAQRGKAGQEVLHSLSCASPVLCL